MYKLTSVGIYILFSYLINYTFFVAMIKHAQGNLFNTGFILVYDFGGLHSGDPF